jgi:hypothetical protein
MMSDEQLRKMTYSELSAELAHYDEGQLFSLLAHRARKVGDSAASEIYRRGLTERAAAEVIAGKLSKPTALVRVASLMHRIGKDAANAAEFYARLIEYRQSSVVDSGLFGLVFLQDKTNIGVITRALEASSRDLESMEMMKRAIAALEAGDPFVYSPNFHDRSDAWRLDRNKYADRIGK